MFTCLIARLNNVITPNIIKTEVLIYTIYDPTALSRL